MVRDRAAGCAVRSRTTSKDDLRLQSLVRNLAVELGEALKIIARSFTGLRGQRVVQRGRRVKRHLRKQHRVASVHREGVVETGRRMQDERSDCRKALQNGGVSILIIGD